MHRMCGTSRVSTWMCDAKPLSVARHNHERYAVGAGMRRSGVRPFRFARQLNRMCGYAQDVRYIARSTWMCGYAQDVRYIARSTWMCGAIVSVSHNIPIVRPDYVQDERYIAKSTRMCGAIVSGLHSISMDARPDCRSLATCQQAITNIPHPDPPSRISIDLIHPEKHLKRQNSAFVKRAQLLLNNVCQFIAFVLDPILI
jgi:hypothetical protein